MTQTLVRSVITASQLVRSGSDDSLWQSDELDENGLYVAQYDRLPSGRGYHKQKLRYRRSHSDRVRHRILLSDTLLELDSVNHLSKVVAK